MELITASLLVGADVVQLRHIGLNVNNKILTFASEFVNQLRLPE